MITRAIPAALLVSALGWAGASVLSARQGATFRSEAGVVLVPVWVTEKNRPVPALTVADFQLTDNGVAQDIALSAAEAQPVDVTLVLDASGTVNGPLLQALKAGVERIAQSLGDDDRVRLVTFGATVSEVFGMRAGRTTLPVDRIVASGETSFYNALAAALMSVPRTDRPQVVFGFSDGLDTASFLDANQVVSLAGSSSAALYLSIVERRGAQPFTNKPRGQLVQPNIARLREAAARTGGLLFENPANAQLAPLFTRVLEDFRRSYLLSYTPRGVQRPGWHKLEVQTKDRRYAVRARQGYEGR